MDRCEACREARPITSLMRRWRVSAPAGPPPAMIEEHPLCQVCHFWIVTLMDGVRAHRTGAPAILGSPSHNDRALLFADQCHLCRELLDSSASIVDCRSRKDDALAWGGFLLCSACDIWLANLAIDGRSARLRAERAVDGPYGSWLHPDLSLLAVTVAISDPAARDAVRATCSQMGVPVSASPPAPFNPGAVLFFEPHEREAYPTWAWDARIEWRARIALASFSRREPLLRAITAGASDWITMPTTPQQITGALQRAFRIWSRPIRVDRETGLAVAHPGAEDRPALWVRPDPGADSFELAWLLRRYTRGYDDLAITGDRRILLFPHAPASQVPAIARRLNRLLLGRCELSLAERSASARPRLDAAG